MKLPELFVAGAGGHARVVIDILERQVIYKIAFLVDRDPALAGTDVRGYRVLGGDEAWQGMRPRPRFAIVAIGDNRTRAIVARGLSDHGVELATAVHPGAWIGSGVSVGQGSVIMAGCVVNADARLGANVIVNTCASVDHDCVVGDNVHVAPGCRLCGDVKVDEGAFLGAGSIVVPGRRIGREAVVGAGAVVLQDIPAGARVAGIPARPI